MWYENGSDYYDLCTMEEFDFRLHPDDMQQGTEAINTANISVSTTIFVLLLII